MTDYKSAGVDTAAGEAAIQLMKADIKKTLNKNVLDNFGGFAGLYDISEAKNFNQPILTTSTDGVGTKIKIAQALDIHNTIGIDLVAMVLNDLVVTGSKPLFLTDYIAVGKLYPKKIKDIVEGISNGCQQAACALIGGETAEHPGVMQENDYDLAAAAVGIVEKKEILGREKVKPGDLIYGMPSTGLHSNGFSLVRKIISHFNLESKPEEFVASLGETLLTPTKIYVNELLEIKDKINSAAHITGGGIAANVARVIPSHLHANINRASWEVPLIFKFLQKESKITIDKFERVFNLGLGMVVITDKDLDLPIIGEIIQRETSTKSDAEPKGGIGGSCALQGVFKF